MREGRQAESEPRRGFFSKCGRSLIISEGWTQEASEHVFLGPKLKTSLIFERNIVPMKSSTGLKSPRVPRKQWEGQEAGRQPEALDQQREKKCVLCPKAEMGCSALFAAHRFGCSLF